MSAQCLGALRVLMVVLKLTAEPHLWPRPQVTMGSSSMVEEYLRHNSDMKANILVIDNTILLGYS